MKRLLLIALAASLIGVGSTTALKADDGVISVRPAVYEPGSATIAQVIGGRRFGGYYRTYYPSYSYFPRYSYYGAPMTYYSPYGYGAAFTPRFYGPYATYRYPYANYYYRPLYGAYWW